MTNIDLNQFTLDELADHWAAWWKQLPTGEEYLRLFVPTLRELATGQPVEPQRLATITGLSLERTRAVLREIAEWDESGQRLVGLGLTSIPTRHRYQVHGHDMYVWCAVDALMFTPLIGASARIQSPCVATGDLIHIDVTPTRVERVEPAGAVVSMLTPPVELASRESACNLNNFYRSAKDAAPWLATYPDGRLVPVSEAFEVLRRGVHQVWGQELSRA